MLKTAFGNYTMLRYHFTVLLLLSGLSSAGAWSCSCIWQGPFAKIYKQSDLVVSGKMVASKGNSVDMSVEQVLSGREFQTDIRIWMQTSDLCRPPVDTFPVGSRWVMALGRINEDVPGSFNPNTPSISHGRIGDYSLSKCGGYWLQLTENRVSGNLVSGTRWDMNPKMTPILLELLVKYINGKLSLEGLTEAARESSVPRELMLDTKSFLRRQ